MWLALFLGSLQERPLCGRRFEAASPTAEGHGYLKERVAAGSLPVPEEGLSFGKLFVMPS